MVVGAALLVGGESRRMGRDKSQLLLGGTTFQARLAEMLSDFPERLLSVGRRTLSVPGFLTVPDLLPDRGPLGALHALLTVCRSEALILVPCDAPLFSRELARFLAQAMAKEWEAVIPITRDGREHPACGVYRKDVLPRLQAQLEAGDGRMRALLASLRTYRLPLADTPFPDRCLTNVNTPQAYDALLAEEQPSSFF